MATIILTTTLGLIFSGLCVLSIFGFLIGGWDIRTRYLIRKYRNKRHKTLAPEPALLY